MARITLRQLLDHAAENDYGLPAYNINNMEQGLAIMEAAEAVNAPVIIQASRGARSYANDIVLAKLIDALAELYPHIPVCMHQDHGNGPATCATAIQYGFTSVKRTPRPPPATNTTSTSPAAWSRWPMPAASRSRANWVFWARWKPAWARPRTATASRASWTTPPC